MVGRGVVLLKPQQTGRGVPERAGHVDVVACARAVTRQHLSRVHVANGCDVKNYRSTRVRDVASDERHTVADRQRKEAIHHSIERIMLE